MKVLSLRSFGLAAATCFALLVTTEAYAQLKIGVVDLQLAMESVKEGKTAKDRLDKLVKDKQTELDTKTDKMKKMEENIQKQLPLLDDKGKKDLLEKYRKEMMDLQKLYVDNQTFLQKKRGELLEPLLKKMSKVVQDLALQEGYSLILDKVDGVVLYHMPAMDVTPEVIKRYNAAK